MVIDYPTRGQRLREGIFLLFGTWIVGLVVGRVLCLVLQGVDALMAVWERGAAIIAEQNLILVAALYYAAVCLLTFARHATDETISLSRNGLERAVRYQGWFHRLGLRDSPAVFVSWDDVSQVAVGLCWRSPLHKESIALRLKARTAVVPVTVVHRDALAVLECIAALVPAAHWTPLARRVLESLRRGVRPSDASSEVVDGLLRLAREAGIRNLAMEDRLRKISKSEPLLERFNAEPERYLPQTRRLLGFIIVEPRPARAARDPPDKRCASEQAKQHCIGA